MSTYNQTMFQSIRDALNKKTNEGGNGLYNEMMKTSPGNTYTVRLLPLASDPKNTFFQYFNHGWVSYATGQYVQALSPMTFGERDPIAEDRFRILRVGSEEDKERVKAIRRSEKYLVNVYVIDDPSNPDNNGKVKILRYGKQLQKIILSAIDGEDSEEFGDRIFDLGKNGVNFKIKCESQGEYPTYVSSRFTSAGKLNLSDAEQAKIYEGAYDLTTVFTLKSYDELKQMLDEHYYCKSTDQEEAVHISAPKKEQKEPANESSLVDFEETIDDQINDLLKDL